MAVLICRICSTGCRNSASASLSAAGSIPIIVSKCSPESPSSKGSSLMALFVPATFLAPPPLPPSPVGKSPGLSSVSLRIEITALCHRSCCVACRNCMEHLRRWMLHSLGCGPRELAPPILATSSVNGARSPLCFNQNCLYLYWLCPHFAVSPSLSLIVDARTKSPFCAGVSFKLCSPSPPPLSLSLHCDITRQGRHVHDALQR